MCDWFDGTLTPRRLLALLNGLPPLGTALARATGDDVLGWTLTDHLLADAVDALRAANWQRGAGASESNRPEPIVRPGQSGLPSKRINDEQAERLKAIVASRGIEEV